MELEVLRIFRKPFCQWATNFTSMICTLAQKDASLLGGWEWVTVGHLDPWGAESIVEETPWGREDLVMILVNDSRGAF